MYSMILSFYSFLFLWAEAVPSEKPNPTKAAQIEVRAPDDLVISCEKGIDLTKLTDPTFLDVGRIHFDSTLVDSFVTQDRLCAAYCDPDTKSHYPGTAGGGAAALACLYFLERMDPNNPDSIYSLNWGLEGLITGVDSFRIDTIDQRVCGKGLILRILTGFLDQITIRDTQRIWLVDCSPFYINEQNRCDPNDDLVWEEPFCDSNHVFTIYGCGPGNGGGGFIFKNTDCTDLAIEYRDEIAVGIPNVCFRIFRRWIIIDWCEYDPFVSPTIGRTEFNVTIDVVDTVSVDLIFETESCSSIPNFENVECPSITKLKWNGNDNCSSNQFLIYSYKIDLFNDSLGPLNQYDVVTGPSKFQEYKIGDSTDQLNPFAFFPAHPFDASGVYPIGIHRIEIRAEDGCGNVSNSTHFFESKDCEGPEILCKTNPQEFELDPIGFIRILASQLIDGMTDNCTETDSISLYFDNDPSIGFIEIYCGDLGDFRQFERTVWIYAEDDWGNVDSCQVTLKVTDPDENCIIKDSVLVLVQTILQKPLHNYEITPYFNGFAANPIPSDCTDSVQFTFSFPWPKYDGFEILKDDEDLNGVDVADIIIIQDIILNRHHRSPYTLSQADVNLSETVTMVDIKGVIGKILGAQTTNWRITDTWRFLDPIDSLPKTKFLCDDVCELLAFKMADMNHSALSYCGETEVEPEPCLDLNYQDIEFAPDEELLIHFKSSNFEDIRGFQLEFLIDTSKLDVYDAEVGSLDETLNYFTSLPTTKSLVYYNGSLNGETHVSSDILFSLKAKSKTSGKLSDCISIHRDRINAVAYDKDLNAYKFCASVISGYDDFGFNAFDFELRQINQDHILLLYSGSEMAIKNIDIFDLQGKKINLPVEKRESNQWLLRTESIPSGYYLIRASGSKGTKAKGFVKF